MHATPQVVQRFICCVRPRARGGGGGLPRGPTPLLICITDNHAFPWWTEQFFLTYLLFFRSYGAPKGAPMKLAVTDQMTADTAQLMVATS